MYKCYDNGKQNESIEVGGIPFRVIRENKLITSIPEGQFTTLDFSGRFEAISFLGMVGQEDKCCEMWGEEEGSYDLSWRLFIGDRMKKDGKCAIGAGVDFLILKKGIFLRWLQYNRLSKNGGTVS